MNTIDIYRKNYEEVCSWHDDEYDKYEWAANYIFELITYDAALDEKFVKDIIEVCKVIIDKRNYDYIKDDNNYIKYILVCQLLDRFQWINWGTSIRGAWFELSKTPDSKVILEKLSNNTEEVHFSHNNLKTLIEFMEEDTYSE